MNYFSSMLNGEERLSSRGFTLIELMVTTAVLAIILGIAIPAFSEITLGNKLSSYANNLVASAHLARSEAIKRNAVVTMCASSNGLSCDSGEWQQGWIITSAGELIFKQQALATGFKITETNDMTDLSFQPTGYGATQATLTVCRAAPSAGASERVVTISLTGRPNVAKTANGIC
jgi:type IV fimbrial biogenesis protein FimT